MIKVRFTKKKPNARVVGKGKLTKNPKKYKVTPKPYKRRNARAILVRKRASNGRFT